MPVRLAWCSYSGRVGPSPTTCTSKSYPRSWRMRAASSSVPSPLRGSNRPTKRMPGRARKRSPRALERVEEVRIDPVRDDVEMLIRKVLPGRHHAGLGDGDFAVRVAQCGRDVRTHHPVGDVAAVEIRVKGADRARRLRGAQGPERHERSGEPLGMNHVHGGLDAPEPALERTAHRDARDRSVGERPEPTGRCARSDSPLADGDRCRHGPQPGAARAARSR